MLRRKHLARRALLVGAAIKGGELALGALAGCGSTGGKLVSFEGQVCCASASRFVNARGWEISLDVARLALARVTLYEGEADLATAALAVVTPTAHAHPGHYEEGGVMGEVLTDRQLDLASGAGSLGVGHGISGHIGSARITFADDLLDGAVILLEGHATRDGDTRLFRARASAADVMSHHDAPEIWACPIDGSAELDEGGRLTFTIHPAHWLDDVPFEMHADGDLDPLLEPHAAFLAGVQDPAAYVFTLDL